MMKLTNLKIGTRLGLGFACLLLFLAISIALGLDSAGQVEGHLKVITDVNNAETKLAMAMRAAVYERDMAAHNVMLLEAADDISREIGRFRDQDQQYRQTEEKLVKMFTTLPNTTPEEMAAIKLISAANDAAMQVLTKTLELRSSGQTDAAIELMLKEATPLQRKLLRGIGEMASQKTKFNENAATLAANSYADSRALMISIGIGALLTGLLIAWRITRSITAPLNNAVQVARTVASGNLTSQIQATAADETGQLLDALKQMNSGLVRIVSQVRNGTDAIATASAEIATGNMDLSLRTEQQAGSLEETASSMEQLTSTVKQNASNALRADRLAAAASGIASKGGAVIADVVKTMDSINETSREIADIVGIIDGLAFQTNILALNAAVEAARAGEQGRGFAVVAAEVRNLAHRSATAAKDIKVLIESSVEKNRAGSTLVAQAGHTMTEIVDSVRLVADIMADINAASQEQGAGIEMINQAVNQMDHATQQNAALVEEAAAAAASLQEQSRWLADVVGVFQLDDRQNHIAVPQRRLPAPGIRSVARPFDIGAERR